jgi:hypothetical protein
VGAFVSESKANSGKSLQVFFGGHNSKQGFMGHGAMIAEEQIAGNLAGKK